MSIYGIYQQNFQFILLRMSYVTDRELCKLDNNNNSHNINKRVLSK